MIESQIKISDYKDLLPEKLDRVCGSEEEVPSQRKNYINVELINVKSFFYNLFQKLIKTPATNHKIPLKTNLFPMSQLQRITKTTLNLRQSKIISFIIIL